MFRRGNFARGGIASAFTVIGLGIFAFTSCDAPPSADTNSAANSAPSQQITESVGVVLRADPNPVPPGNPQGVTTITWDTGSDAEGEVFVVTSGVEKLFASGRVGSQEAPWIPPGGAEFRLYTAGDRKLLARLTVTMFAVGR